MPISCTRNYSYMYVFFVVNNAIQVNMLMTTKIEYIIIIIKNIITSSQLVYKVKVVNRSFLGENTQFPPPTRHMTWLFLLKKIYQSDMSCLTKTALSKDLSVKDFLYSIYAPLQRQKEQKQHKSQMYYVKITLRICDLFSLFRFYQQVMTP